MEHFDDKKIKDMLVRENYISDEEMKQAEETAREKGVPLVEHLLNAELITQDIFGQAIAESYGVPFANMKSQQPPSDQVLQIPKGVARRFRAVLFREDEKAVTIATDKPNTKGIKKELASIFPDREIIIAYSLPDAIDDIFLYYQETLETRFSQIIENEGRVAPELLDEIFEDAFSFQASDIHFEPRQDKVLVRFRVDGVLQEAGQIPKEHYDNILNRIKVMSGLRIDEHFAAQDGSMRYDHNRKKSEKENTKAKKKTQGKNKDTNNGTSFDMRTSIVPTIEGEKVVLRILASYIQGLSLSGLGLSEADKEIFEKASRKPFGMILVTGPTGSGKTTTLYALLKILSSPQVNITTIEDPVEYKMRSVNQIQVNKETNLTFAKGLRSIVRQDPDTILVGEIRDEETVEIAVNAALTGHLMLSTFHANDASTAIPRLLDMNAEPFLLASTLELLVAQRLVRKICEDCRYSVETTKKEIGKQHEGAEKFFEGKKITLYEGKGCVSCGNTGYSGRTAIFEMIKITPEIENLILDNPSSAEIWELAEEQGAHTLYEDGIDKVKHGVTTLTELERVAEPPRKRTKKNKIKK